MSLSTQGEPVWVPFPALEVLPRRHAFLLVPLRPTDIRLLRLAGHWRLFAAPVSQPDQHIAADVRMALTRLRRRGWAKPR